MSLVPRRRALTGWVFLRLLGAVHLVAFASLAVQLDGLVGTDGILPVAEFLERLGSLGPERFHAAPTLLWVDASDAALYALCAVGIVAALLVIADVAVLPALVLCWGAYLSLSVGGQAFLSFQWDTLLLESTLVALFVAPRSLGPRWPIAAPEPHPAGVWLLRLLTFKLMFLSGVTKLLSLDPAWWNLGALHVHYYTQPLPAWTSWYAHHLPHLVQQASVAISLGIEIAVPFAVFGPRRLRVAAAALLVLLQVLIAATGNYGFFNLLSIVLCVPLLDDRDWTGARSTGAGPPRAPVLVVGAALLAAVSSLTLVEELVATARGRELAPVVARPLEAADRRLVQPAMPVLRAIHPFRTINGYGLFRTMTTSRPEIVVEGSRDGRTWTEYAFRWKPGDPARRPRFVAPHMPRLDWQMWFAALSPRRATWLTPFLRALLEGRPEVLGLLARDPFEGTPPRYVRLVTYDYEFTDPEEREASGHWWRRTPRGALTRPLSLEDLTSKPVPDGR